MKRIFVMVVALSIGAWWWSHSRRAQPAVPDAAKTERVLAELAAYRGGLRWETSHGGGTAEGDGVYFRTIQDARASIEVNDTFAAIETPTWHISVRPRLVTEVVCERRYNHDQDPPYSDFNVSFRKGPDDRAGYPDELFTVSFDRAREADFTALCKRHGLRTVWW